MLNHYICKIEGHGNLRLDYKASRARLTIDEGERLFETLLIGRGFLDAPFITARICGICPTAHTLASIKAVENALGISVPSKVIALRKALLAGQIIQSHALHLYFLAAPDYLDVVNAIELHEEHPHIYKNAIALKKVGDLMVEIIGGRAVHPTAPTVGGFLSLPDNKKLEGLVKELTSNLHVALETVELFAGFKYPKLERKTEYLAIAKNGYIDYYDGDQIISNQGLKTAIDNYPYTFTENVRSDSPAKYATRDDRGFMVGALSRLSLSPQNLNKKAGKAYKHILPGKFPTYNSYHNNVAQALEVLHLLEEAIHELTKVLEDKRDVHKVPFKVVESKGIGVVEAPRGTLYHSTEIDKKGDIRKYDIITPTVQNLVNLEEDANELMKLHKGEKENKLFSEVEMLIRAYDPCITCAVH